MTWELFAVFIGSSIRLAMPLLLAGIGELVSERAGVLNMSLEGMMLTGAFAAAVGAWATGNPLIGLGIGVVAVFPVAALQAFLSVTLRANQIVTGIGINILVLGATTLAYREIFGSRSREEIPGLDEMEAAACSATSPCSATRCSSRSGCSISASSIIALTAFVLRYTSLGLTIHAAGEEPRAVDKSGLSVIRDPLRWWCCSQASWRRWRVLPVDRRHPHLHRGHDQRRRLPRARRRHLRQLEDPGHHASPACCSAPPPRCSSSCRPWGSPCPMRC